MKTTTLINEKTGRQITIYSDEFTGLHTVNDKTYKSFNGALKHARTQIH